MIFIFEKSDIHYDVSSNLVRLYMNRSIIDEDGEFEILGVIQFIDEISWNQFGHTFDYDMLGYLKTKIGKHLNIASEVMNRSFRTKNLDTHLIVGLPIPHILRSFSGSSRINDISDGFLWSERSRYWNDDLPHLIAKSITSLVQLNFLSNKLGKLSSYTVLNEWQNRTIGEWEIKRRSVMDLDQASHGRPNLEITNVNQASSEQASVKPVQTIDQDVDGFYEHLSCYKFQRLNRFQRLQRLKTRILGMLKENQSYEHPLLQWREGFRRYKLWSEVEEDDENIEQSFLAAEAMLNEALDFDDNSSEYIEYLGNRFTYY